MLTGGRFGYREHPRNVGDPLSPAEVVKDGPHRSGKVKVRWLDGDYEGLEVWVPKVRLVVPWEEADALMADERRIVIACGDRDATHTVPWEAAEEVFFALPRDVEVGFGYRAYEQDLLHIYDLAKTAPQIGMTPEELLAEPNAFVDRHGDYRAPFETAVKVAKACCARFPEEVVRRADREESAIREAAITEYYVSPEGDHDSRTTKDRAEKWLAEKAPVYALMREWCGKAEVARYDRIVELEAEVSRLQELVRSAAESLKALGRPQMARRLLADMQKLRAGKD